MSKIKVGDKVEVVGVTHRMNLKGVHLGAVAEVVCVDGLRLKVRFKCGEEWWASFVQEEYVNSFERGEYDIVVVKKGEDPCDGVNPQKMSIESEETPTEGDASKEAVAQGYKTIVEKGVLTVYTNLPVKVIGDIIVVGEKGEL